MIIIYNKLTSKTMSSFSVLSSSQYEENKIVNHLVGKVGSHVFLSNLLTLPFGVDALETKYYKSKELIPLFNENRMNKEVLLNNEEYQVRLGWVIVVGM